MEEHDQDQPTSPEEKPSDPIPVIDNHERRRKIIVDKELQLYHFSAMAICVFVMIATFFSILLASGYTRLTEDWVALTALMIMFAAAPAMGIHSIIHSHRVAGPVVHFKKGLIKFLERDFDYQMVLRDGDYFTTLAQLYNQAALDMARRQRELEEVEEGLVALAASLDGESREKVQEILTKLQNAVEKRGE